ncbi:MAG: hypothetical protein LBG94_01295 [Treponema sp.]|nr:hypothetical protein [Treponema sp.]
MKSLKRVDKQHEKFIHTARHGGTATLHSNLRFTVTLRRPAASITRYEPERKTWRS